MGLRYLLTTSSWFNIMVCMMLCMSARLSLILQIASPFYWISLFSFLHILAVAIAIAIAYENAPREAVELGKGSTATAQAHINRKQRRLLKHSPSSSLDRCFSWSWGCMRHTPQNLKCKEMDRLLDNKPSHIARVCPSKIKSNPSSKHQWKPARHRLLKMSTAEVTEDEMAHNTSAENTWWWSRH